MTLLEGEIIRCPDDPPFGKMTFFAAQMKIIDRQYEIIGRRDAIIGCRDEMIRV
jgi:hypothetical protein